MRTFFLPLAVLALAGITADADMQTPDVRVVAGATLINPTPAAPVSNAVIVITGSRITEVGTAASVKPPAGAQVIDATGKFVIPGLADMHNHLEDGGINQRQNRLGNLGRLLAVGVTTVFDPSVPEDDFAKLKAAATADSAAYPRFFGTGPSITVEGDTLGSQSPKPKTPDEARAVVQKLKALGVDAIKVARDDLTWASTRAMPLMPAEVLQALVDEAHRLQLKVYVHAPQLARAREALRAGVDGLLHGIVDEPIDQDFVSLLKKNGALYVPTLGMFEDVADVSAFARRQSPYWDQLGLQPPAIYSAYISGFGVQLFQTLLNNSASTKQHLPVLRANLKQVFDAGIPIVMGTDTGFFGVLLGVATPLEMELMVEAGLKPADVIRAATINAARMIGREKEQGTIEAANVADLLILDANPLENIGAVRRIYRVVKGGVVYDPARLSR
ncbi:MAG TPA: amidohydrolase family protein [Vicinamibacterales bacterium]|nr:amidohydrolase family protein [Vicinamibacterales bacterium]